MSALAVALLIALVITVAVAAYTAGEWRGHIRAMGDLWDSAADWGAYAQLLRIQADVEGVTVVELLDRERRSE